MNTSESQSLSSQLIRSGFGTVLRWLAPAMLGVGYVMGLVLGLDAGDAFWGITRLLLPLFAVAGVLLPWWTLSLLVRRQLEGRAEEPAEERLKRLFMLPWKLATAAVGGPSLLMGLVYATAMSAVFHRGPGSAVLAVLVALAAGVALILPVGLGLEQLLMPHVLAEQGRVGKRPEGEGFFWQHHSWHLPFVAAGALLLTLPLFAVVASAQVSRLHEAQVQALRANTSLSSEQAAVVAAQLDGFSDAVTSALGPALVLLAGFTLLLPLLGGWVLARRQARAAAALSASLQALSEGLSKPSEWTSADELGALSAGLESLRDRFQSLPSSLQSTASQLTKTSNIMESAGAEHRQSMMQQASALQEAQVTSQEIKQTSALASRRVEAVLKVVARAESLGASGEAALQKTFAGLTAIREFTEGIRGRVLRVQECALQISDIAVAVQDLASQSNVLSINAAIEASRLGDEGRGSSVVAQEFRKLANQSIRETVRISRILREVGGAILELVNMAEQGAQQVESGLEMVNSSADSLREVSAIIKESAQATRMIATAVSQQDTGISQIFTAISQLAGGMEEAMRRMETTLEAGRSLETVTQQVQELARHYHVNGTEGLPPGAEAVPAQTVSPPSMA